MACCGARAFCFVRAGEGLQARWLVRACELAVRLFFSWGTRFQLSDFPRSRSHQKNLSDFGLCGHVAIKSDATSAIGFVIESRIRKRSTFSCWKCVVSNITFVLGKFESPKTSALQKQSDAQAKYFGPETTAAPYESV